MVTPATPMLKATLVCSVAKIASRREITAVAMTLSLAQQATVIGQECNGDYIHPYEDLLELMRTLEH